MEEKNYANDAYGNRQFDDLFLEGIYGPLDEVGPVIGGHDLHSLGEAGGDILLDPLFDAFYDVEDILPEPHYHNTRRHLALAVEFRDTPSYLRPDLDSSYIFQKYRRPLAIRPDGNVFQILQTFNVAAPSDHVFNAGKLQDSSFHVAVALFDGIHQRHDGNIESQEPVGINGNLVLLDKST